MKTRTLKIEAVGDFAAQNIKPRIRICGNWPTAPASHPATASPSSRPGRAS